MLLGSRKQLQRCITGDGETDDQRKNGTMKQQTEHSGTESNGLLQTSPTGPFEKTTVATEMITIAKLRMVIVMFNELFSLGPPKPPPQNRIPKT
eukprot:6146007-Amphidinium_carterae.1